MHHTTQIFIKSFLLLKGAALIPLLQIICLLALSTNDFLLDLTTRQVLQQPITSNTTYIFLFFF